MSDIRVSTSPFFPGRAVANTPVVGNIQPQIDPSESGLGVMGLLEKGNIKTGNRPIVHNPDASSSTVRSITIGTDGGYYLLPTVSEDGRLLTNKQAIQQFRDTGKHLGRFDSEDNANAYGNALHQSQANMVSDQPSSIPMMRLQLGMK